MKKNHPDTFSPKLRGSLKRTLWLYFLLLALLPMSIVAWLSYQQTYDSLFFTAKTQLESSSRMKVAFIRNWFHYRFLDIETQAIAESTSSFLSLLRNGYHNSNKSLAEFATSFEWASIVSNSDSDLQTMLRYYDYIYDIFLIDNEGNILYSIAREQDFATNLFKGLYSETLFAKNVQSTLKTGHTQLSDIERYAPSNDLLSSFITAILLDDNGDKIGVIALQLRLDFIFNLLASDSQFSSLTHYLVGTDGLLRSSTINDESILKQLINTGPVEHWLEGGAKTQHNEYVNRYVGPNGVTVIGYHEVIKIPGVSWLLLHEINLSEAVKSATDLGFTTFLLTISTGLLAVIMVYLLVQRIIKPLQTIAQISLNVADASKKTNKHIIMETRNELSKISVNNEIGTLAEVFSYMLLKNQQYTDDLSESKESAQKALFELFELQQAIDHHSIVVTTDKDGVITDCNEKFCDISGYSDKEIIGETHAIINSGYHDDEFWGVFWTTISTGKVWQGNICNTDKTGVTYWVRTTVIPFLDEKGNPESYIAIRTDITEEKKTQDRLVDATKTAEQASQAKSLFLANMSHEIRTPMNGVIGMTTLMLADELSGEQKARAVTIKHSAELLLAIINDILDFSKIEAGKMELEIIEFDLNELIDTFSNTFSNLKSDDLAFICPVKPIHHHWYRGDAGRILQILTNLVGNAFKFTKKGKISVDIHCDKTHKREHQLTFTIADTGIGLNQQQCDNLFKKFNQADNSTTRKFGGTGLGLAISKELVELMDGELHVVSEPDVGSKFIFSINLPAIEDKKDADHPPDTKQRQLPQYQARILVVDDNIVNQKVAQGMLKKFGVTIDLAANGQESLIALEKFPYDLVFMDCQMPVMDGFQATKCIRDTDSKVLNHDIPIIAMTANAMQSDREECLDVGMNDFMSKPISIAKLDQMLETWLGFIPA